MTTIDAAKTEAVETMLASAATWARSRANVVGLVLVGSYARGTARADSDIDIVVIVEDVQVLVDDPHWAEVFGTILSREKRDYGLVQSVFATYASGVEVEWCLTDWRWLSTAPVDPDTAGVVAAGARVLYDPHRLVSAFIDAVAASRGAVPRPSDRG